LPGNIPYNRAITVDNDDLLFRFDSGNADNRFIFTWNDLNNDGVVDYNADPTKHELRDFEAGLPVMGSIAGGSLPSVNPADNRGPVPVDFGVDPSAPDAENQVNNIIKWVRGMPVSGMRDRTLPVDQDALGMQRQVIELTVAIERGDFGCIGPGFPQFDACQRFRYLRGYDLVDFIR